MIPRSWLAYILCDGTDASEYHREEENVWTRRIPRRFGLPSRLLTEDLATRVEKSRPCITPCGRRPTLILPASCPKNIRCPTLKLVDICGSTIRPLLLTEVVRIVGVCILGFMIRNRLKGKCSLLLDLVCVPSRGGP